MWWCRAAGIRLLTIVPWEFPERTGGRSSYYGGFRIVLQHDVASCTIPGTAPQDQCYARYDARDGAAGRGGAAAVRARSAPHRRGRRGSQGRPAAAWFAGLPTPLSGIRRLAGQNGTGLYRHRLRQLQPAVEAGGGTPGAPRLPGEPRKLRRDRRLAGPFRESLQPAARRRGLREA